MGSSSPRHWNFKKNFHGNGRIIPRHGGDTEPFVVKKSMATKNGVKPMVTISS
jgi:hypothetical protein